MPAWDKLRPQRGSPTTSDLPLIADLQRAFADFAFGPILLKRSLDAVDLIFSASLVRFLNEDAVDLIVKRRSDVNRSKSNFEAIDG